MTMGLRCAAKVNLWLRVLGRSEDGYHDVETVLHTVDLCDTLLLTPGGAGIHLCSDRRDLEGTHNLAWRAADLLRKAGGCQVGLEMTLCKRIPVAAGLGGGSSDAAAALRGANRLWQLGLSEEELRHHAAGLGSDVPFFVRGGCALGMGRGDRLTELNPLDDTWVVIVNPLFPLSAAQVYGWLPAGLTAQPTVTTMVFEIFERGDLAEIVQYCVNDLEQGLLPRYPLLGDVKQELVRAGALGALVSGSGPSVFGLCATRVAAQEVARSVSGPGRAVFVCRTMGPVESSGVVQVEGQQPLEL